MDLPASVRGPVARVGDKVFGYPFALAVASPGGAVNGVQFVTASMLLKGRQKALAEKPILAVTADRDFHGQRSSFYAG